MKKILNRDQIKYFAMLAMLLNHIQHVFPTRNFFLGQFMEEIGYFTAITMCYFMVEGFYYTSSRKKYLVRLGIFALISQIPFHLALAPCWDSFFAVNMLGSLTNCFVLLCLLDRTENHKKQVLYLVISMFIGVFCDWAFMAPLFIYMFYHARKDGSYVKSYLLGILAFALFDTLMISPWFTLSQRCFAMLFHISGPFLSMLAVLLLYNGKKMEKGRTFNKWFFYLFYPGHLAVLAILRYLPLK